MTAFRTMTSEDIPAGLSLCRLAGWNQLSRDWDLFLQTNGNGCRVALDEAGKVIGTVTTLPYENHFSWIGMVLVHPAKQRQGIGTQLLMEALRLLRDHETIKLDATPAGREVYVKLKFTDEYRIERMHRTAHGVNNAYPSTARAMQEDDVQGILKFDRDVFGADRKFILEWNMKGAPQYAFVVEDQGEIKGFCLGRPGYNFDHIGPIVAQTLDHAIQLLVAAVRQAPDKPVIIDALNHTPEWTKFISSLGFVSLRPLIRMYCGLNLYPGIPERQFAIMGPEFG